MDNSISISDTLNRNIDEVWNIVSDLTRSDWVSGVEEITLEKDIRSFKMSGMGGIKEKIILCDQPTKRLQYKAIQTPISIDHHLATIELKEIKNGCILKWTTEIEPLELKGIIEKSMKESLDKLKEILS